MRKISLLAAIAILSTLLLFSCGPGPGPSSSCADCHESYTTDAKMKRIEVMQGTSRKALFEFQYLNNLLDSVSLRVYYGTDSSWAHYRMYYTHCMLSGIWSSLIDTLTHGGSSRKWFYGEAALRIDSDKVKYNIDTWYEAVPFNSPSLKNRYEYGVSNDSTIGSRLKRCISPGCLQFGQNNENTFDATKNVTAVNTRTDEPLYYLTNSGWDPKVNPFNMQHGIFYYLALHPFSFAVPRMDFEYNDMLDFIELSRSNPTVITKRSPHADEKQYTLDYTYDAVNRPTLIVVKVAQPISGTAFGPAVVAGELRVSYY